MTLTWPKMNWSHELWQVWHFKHDSISHCTNDRSMNDQWINDVDPNWIYPYRVEVTDFTFCIQSFYMIHIIVITYKLWFWIVLRLDWDNEMNRFVGWIILRFGQSLLFMYHISIKYHTRPIRNCVYQF